MSALSIYMTAEALSRLHQLNELFASEQNCNSPVMTFLIRDNEVRVGFLSLDWKSVNDIFHSVDGIISFIENISEIEDFFKRRYLDCKNGQLFSRGKGPNIHAVAVSVERVT